MRARTASSSDKQANRVRLKAPLVGEKLPCETITVEYAKADPVYVEKTLVSSYNLKLSRP